MVDEFIRPRPIELNDDEVEMDKDKINEFDQDLYTGDDTVDINPKSMETDDQ